MQSTHTDGGAWSYLLELTDHPSPKRVTRFALKGFAAASLYVGVLAALGVFTGAVWWLSAGAVCIALLGVVR